jgi:hypothetical protein
MKRLQTVTEGFVTEIAVVQLHKEYSSSSLEPMSGHAPHRYERGNFPRVALLRLIQAFHPVFIEHRENRKW